MKRGSDVLLSSNACMILSEFDACCCMFGIEFSGGNQLFGGLAIKTASISFISRSLRLKLLRSRIQ